MYNKYYTVSIIGLEPTRPGYTLWFGLVRTVHPGLVPRPGRLKTNYRYCIQGVSKKMSFSGKTAITTFKLIQNANVGGVLENSGNLLYYGH